MKMLGNLELLIRELIKQPHESSWLEFKHNNFDPDLIGADISALANSAVLADREYSYMIWGINDTNHEIIGTEITQFSKLKGNQEIGNWLRTLLSSNADFEFNEISIDGKKILLLTIGKAIGFPVSFKKQEFIRIGSYTKKLIDFPTVQVQLWDKIRLVNFENITAEIDLKLLKPLYPDTAPRYMSYIPVWA